MSPWMRVLCFVLLTSVLSEAQHRCESQVPESEHGSLLQLKNSSNSSQIAATLQGLRSSCLQGLKECLPLMDLYRSLIWPKVMILQGPSTWFPSIPWRYPYIYDTLDDAMAWLSCNDGTENLILFYRHIWKAAGHSIFENLEHAFPGGRPYQGSMGHGEIPTHGLKVVGSAEFCANFDPFNSRHLPFTFVRDPISRFLAGYAEIEERVRQRREGFESLIQALEQYPTGSSLRALAFFQEFLKDGINGDGHVKPQVEYLGQSQGCFVPMRFVGKVENITVDWQRMFHQARCDQGAFDTSLGLHPNDPQDRSSMESLIQPQEHEPFTLSQTSQVTQVTAATRVALRRRDMASMEEVLLRSSSLQLRTLCWIYLPDFVVFHYELPKYCQEEPALREIWQQLGI